jgi:mannose/cellobiose epimerase-like protein (N-acyl-D-glucosamine 2-epimerase family)
LPSKPARTSTGKGSSKSSATQTLPSQPPGSRISPRLANGINRATGLAWGAVSREGLPLERVSRSWPQAEAVKSAIALDRAGGPDRGPEIEERLSKLFAWHLDPAPPGLWLDRIDEHGRPVAGPVPASILYHLVSCLTAYLDYSEGTASEDTLP